MFVTTSRVDLVVVGGGVIGLASAWRAAQSGRSVAVVDPAPGRGAAWVAAGMLAPASEASFGEERLVALLLEGANEWASFATDLEKATGCDIGYRRTGTLLMGHDSSDRSEVARTAAFQRSIGLDLTELDREALMAIEPNLAPGFRSAVLLEGDHQVNNRGLVSALIRALDQSDVRMIPLSAAEIVPGSAESTVVLDDGSTVVGSAVLLALGAHTSSIKGIDPAQIPTIRPVKGHILRLKGAAPLLAHTVRAVVKGRSVYLVPRSDGELVVGATVEERGFDITVQAGEVFRLLEDARRVLPGIDELELSDASAGLRPGSPDNVPTIAWIGGSTVALATGHYRNGILLAPLTATLVTSLLDGAVHPAMTLILDAHEEG